MDGTLLNALPAPLFTLAGSAFLGFIVGKAIQLIAKIAAVIAGFIVLMLGALDYYGIISVNYPLLQKTVQAQAENAYNQTSLIVHHMAHAFGQSAASHVMAGGVGFLGGVLLAFRK